MSNYSLRKRLISAAALMVCLAAPAVAQDNLPAPMLPGAPVAAPAPAAPKLPEGATLSGSTERVKNMSAEAGRGLDELLGNTIDDRDKAEIESYAQEKREQLFLKLQLEKAQIARELFFEINGEQNEYEEETKKLKDENDRLKNELETAKTASAEKARIPVEPDPVVTSIFGSAGNLKAQIVTASSGTAMAKAGTVLPNGMKVVSINKSGVTVEQDGERKTLLFATR